MVFENNYKHNSAGKHGSGSNMLKRSFYFTARLVKSNEKMFGSTWSFAECVCLCPYFFLLSVLQAAAVPAAPNQANRGGALKEMWLPGVDAKWVSSTESPRWFSELLELLGSGCRCSCRMSASSWFFNLPSSSLIRISPPEICLLDPRRSHPPVHPRNPTNTDPVLGPKETRKREQEILFTSTSLPVTITLESLISPLQISNSTCK